MTLTADREEVTAPALPSPSEGYLFLRALVGVFGRIPLWFTSWLGLWLLALVAALPWYAEIEEMVTSRYPLTELVHDLDTNFRTDHRSAIGALNQGSARSGALLALIAALFGVFTAGGWLQVILERTQGQSLRRFFYGGARYFWRFTRVLVLVLLVLAGLRWVFYGMPWNELVLGRLLHVPAGHRDSLESLDSELLAHQVRWAQAGLFALGFALVIAWGIYTRTRLALFDTHSALLAGLASAWTLVAHPIRTLRPLFLLFVIELGVLMLAGATTEGLNGRLAGNPGFAGVLMLHVVAQLALVWRQITRGADYYVAVQASRAIIPPPPRPDPWKTIGGPGGPQYPVDDDDEYGVAL